MGFYDEKDNAESYIEMANGYDGSDLISELEHVLPSGSSVLELGMGPGVDLNLLSKNFKSTGSDNSSYFVDRYRKLHPKADTLLLDAVSLSTQRKFDAIYSNKVLHHLNDNDLSISFSRQSEVLSEGGIIMHSFWNGESVEQHHGLVFHNRTPQRTAELLGDGFSIIEQAVYEELEPDDSHWLLARKT